ncbi:hypothetical protein ACLOJK_017237 [Asimina triloba]
MGILNSPAVDLNLGCNSNGLNALDGFLKGLDSGVIGWRNDSSSGCCSWIGISCDIAPGLGKQVVGLDLGSFQLKGAISKSIAELDQLRVLNLSANGLHGALPLELFHLQNLHVLDLSDNQFSGTIPLDIDLPSIQVFNLPDNFFEGRRPLLLQSSNLKAYVIRGNLFSGSVDVDICNVSRQIQVVDFSYNGFSGNIPVGIERKEVFRNISAALKILQQCTNPTTLVLAGNFQGEEMPIVGIQGFESLKILSIPNSGLSGPITPWLGNCTELRALDLSRNLLWGGIPSWIDELVHLAYLNLSQNSLAGEITINLTQLPGFYPQPFLLPNYQTEQMEYDQLIKLPPSLDLSKNKLKGHIWPEFGIVANNRLEGAIPSGGQFSTFLSSSFEGNSGLCGTYFLVCMNTPAPDQLPPRSSSNEEEEEEETDSSIMGAPFGIGAATGFAVSVITGFCFPSSGRWFQVAGGRRRRAERFASPAASFAHASEITVWEVQGAGGMKMGNAVGDSLRTEK